MPSEYGRIADGAYFRLSQNPGSTVYRRFSDQTAYRCDLSIPTPCPMRPDTQVYPCDRNGRLTATDRKD